MLTRAIMGTLATAGMARAEAEVIPLACYDSDVGGYNVSWSEGGFVLYAAGEYDIGLMRLFLEDCAGGQRLEIVTGPAGSPEAGEEVQDRVAGVVEKALESKQGYTLGQIGAMAREAGAKVTLGKTGYVSCGCERYGQ